MTAAMLLPLQPGETLDLVCPVYAGAAAHFEFWLASFARYWHIPGTLFVCAPDADLPLFAELLRDEPRAQLIPKRQLIGNAAYDSVRPTHGWYRQQMAKLGASHLVSTPLYLAVDADCFCARHLHSVWDLLRVDGRIPWAMQDVPLCGDRRRVYTDTAMALGSNTILPTHSTLWRPPFLFHTATMQAGLVQTEHAFETNWRDILRATPSWAEPAYYHLAARDAGTWETLHKEIAPDACGTHEFITYPPPYGAEGIETQFVAWNPHETFSGQYNFGVVHSHTGIDPTRTRAKLEAAGKL